MGVSEHCRLKDTSVTHTTPRSPVPVCRWSDLPQRAPQAALVADVDLVIIRDEDRVFVLYGRCPHRGAMLADGRVEGPNLICGLHEWDFRFETGVSEYNNSETVARFHAWIDHEQDAVLVDEQEVRDWEQQHPQHFRRDSYLGQYADLHGTDEEPHTAYIQQLARDGLNGTGHHGVMSAMGVPLTQLPRWQDLQLLTAQAARRPLADHEPVDSTLVIGPAAQKPLRLQIPLFVSDMSFGALSQEAKVALAQGAEAAGTGICSGEGGMLPEEQQSCSRYLYELASGMFGWSQDKLRHVQAFHFKLGQGAKTGTGGHLPGHKVTPEIAAVRGLSAGEAAISPPRFEQLKSVEDFQQFATQVRETTGGVPVGFKMSAQHIEDDLDFALAVGVDYIILDGRGGGTGAAPNVLRDNISVATIPALARARKHLDARQASNVTLIITGGLRTESDFVKALALGADGVAVSNSALQAIGCLGMRACHTNNCPVGIATQKPHLRERLLIDRSAKQLQNYFEATTELMKVVARACGHDRFSQFSAKDLTTYQRQTAALTGVRYAGVTQDQY